MIFHRFQPYPRYSNNNNVSTVSNNNSGANVSQCQSPLPVKTEGAISSVTTSGAPLSPLVEPHSNTSTPLVDEPQMTNQRQRNGMGDDGECYSNTLDFFSSHSFGMIKGRYDLVEWCSVLNIHLLYSALLERRSISDSTDYYK